MNRMVQICSDIRDGEEQTKLIARIKLEKNLVLGLSIFGGALISGGVASGSMLISFISAAIGGVCVVFAVGLVNSVEKSCKYQDRTYFKQCLAQARNLEELELAGLDVPLHPDLYAKLEDDL